MMSNYFAEMVQPQSLRSSKVIIGAEWVLKADIWNFACLAVLSSFGIDEIRHRHTEEKYDTSHLVCPHRVWHRLRYMNFLGDLNFSISTGIMRSPGWTHFNIFISNRRFIWWFSSWISWQRQKVEAIFWRSGQHQSVLLLAHSYLVISIRFSATEIQSGIQSQFRIYWEGLVTLLKRSEIVNLETLMLIINLKERRPTA